MDEKKNIVTENEDFKYLEEKLQEMMAGKWKKTKKLMIIRFSDMGL